MAANLSHVDSQELSVLHTSSLQFLPPTPLKRASTTYNPQNFLQILIHYPSTFDGKTQTYSTIAWIKPKLEDYTEG